jgi:hypothetical protein
MYTIQIFWISGHIDIEQGVSRKRIDHLKSSKSVVEIKILEHTR